jgi:tRNA synthetases class I (R)
LFVCRESKRRFDEEEDFKARAREAVTKLQAGDPAFLEAWRLLCEISRKVRMPSKFGMVHAGFGPSMQLKQSWWCACRQPLNPCCVPLQDFEKIYVRLGIEGLTERGESFYNPMLTGVVADLVDRGIATDSNGATCIFIEVGPMHSSFGRPANLCKVLHGQAKTIGGSAEVCIMLFNRCAGGAGAADGAQVGRRLRLRHDRHGGHHAPHPHRAGRLGDLRRGRGAGGPLQAGASCDGRVCSHAQATGSPAWPCLSAGAQVSTKHPTPACGSGAFILDMQVFAAARKAGILPADAAALPRVSHVGFGLVLGEDGKRFRTRASEVGSAAVPSAQILVSSPRWRVLL